MEKAKVLKTLEKVFIALAVPPLIALGDCNIFNFADPRIAPLVEYKLRDKLQEVPCRPDNVLPVEKGYLVLIKLPGGYHVRGYHVDKRLEEVERNWKDAERILQAKGYKMEENTLKACVVGEVIGLMWVDRENVLLVSPYKKAYSCESPKALGNVLDVNGGYFACVRLMHYKSLEEEKHEKEKE